MDSVKRTIADVKIGEAFGRWVVAGECFTRLYSGKYRSMVVCQCSCGVVREVLVAGLLSRGSLSCGCLQREAVAEAGRRRMGKHGLSDRMQSWLQGFVSEGLEGRIG